MQKPDINSTLLDIFANFPGLQIKLGRINFCGVWSDSRREYAMLGGLGDADRVFTHAILGPTHEERQVDKDRMTISH